MKKIQKIYKEHSHEVTTINAYKRDIFQIIGKCGSGELGYHKIKCEECHQVSIRANTCRSRFCPHCQKRKKEEWIETKKASVISCRYNHIIMTIPRLLYQIIRQNQEKLLEMLMKESAEAVQRIGREDKRLGIEVGIIEMIHTWNQELDEHPHVHMLVTTGGIDKNGKWKEVEGKYLMPVKVLSKVYKGKIISKLEEKYEELEFYGEMEKYKDKKEFKKLLEELAKKEFVTYIKEAYEKADTVIEYFGRYVYNVGISESRIKEYDGEEVVYEYKDRKEGKKKEKRVTAKEFIEKMSFHILPKGFRKIRSYGILSNRGNKERIKKINNEIKNKKNRKKFEEKKEAIKKGVRCPKCGSTKCVIEKVDKGTEKILRRQIE